MPRKFSGTFVVKEVVHATKETEDGDDEKYRHVLHDEKQDIRVTVTADESLVDAGDTVRIEISDPQKKIRDYAKGSR